MRNLLLVDPAVFSGQRTRGIDPEDSDFRIAIDGRKVGRDITPVTTQRTHEPADHIPERDVVIPRDHQPRCRQAGEESLRRLVFETPRALGEITRDHSEIRSKVARDRDHWLDQGVVHPPKMQIGEMEQRPHFCISGSRGASTQSASGATRKRSGLSSLSRSPSTAARKRRRCVSIVTSEVQMTS